MSFEDLQHRMTRVDHILLTLMALLGVYGLVLLPLSPKLLVEAPQLLAALNGSGIALVVVGAQAETTGSAWLPWLALATVTGSVSLPIFYLLGRRWGDDVVRMLFASGPPRWFRKAESSVRRFPSVWLGLAFVPFSPVPTPVVVALAGIERIRWQVVTALVLAYSLALKGFFLALGYRFGSEVTEVVVTIDRYMMYITLAVVAYVFWKAYRSGRSGTMSTSEKEMRGTK